ncbi:MAG: ImmA/IrrE family metallo-endopeptidase, partial [Leptospiraceae bacterium]|nr:ImmA/IrrE family metallo-endopeptidase [Leptospiraceae bacterium]
MTRIKEIKSEEQNQRALARIEELMDKEVLSQSEERELSQLASLVETFEEQEYPIDPPDPIAAIRFRMEQQGLKQKDLVPFLGDKSKVSRVLSGELGLSKAMIRKLHDGLNIPLQHLLGETRPLNSIRNKDTDSSIDWIRFPIKDMIKREWLPAHMRRVTSDGSALQKELRKLLPDIEAIIRNPAYLRKGEGKNMQTDPFALIAYQARAAQLARQTKIVGKFSFDAISTGFRSDLAKTSYFDKGPLLAREFLAKNGIRLIFLPHLPNTYLDGMAFMLSPKEPVIVMSLRYDRLDNFWFVLFHELAHVALHLREHPEKPFVDDVQAAANSDAEREADRWALQSFFSDEVWSSCKLSIHSTVAEVRDFARINRISPAIPAGRLRRESGNYRAFTSLIGQGEVQTLLLDGSRH